MSTKCLPLFHRYSKWVDIELLVRPNISNVVGMPVYSNERYKTDGQKRVCMRCGKKQQRIIS